MGYSNVPDLTFLQGFTALKVLYLQTVSIVADSLSNLLRPLKSLSILTLDNSPNLTGNLTLDCQITILNTFIEVDHSQEHLSAVCSMGIQLF
jgi:hypothetical protein